MRLQRRQRGGERFGRRIVGKGEAGGGTGAPAAISRASRAAFAPWRAASVTSARAVAGAFMGFPCNLPFAVAKASCATGRGGVASPALSRGAERGRYGAGPRIGSGVWFSLRARNRAAGGGESALSHAIRAQATVFIEKIVNKCELSRFGPLRAGFGPYPSMAENTATRSITTFTRLRRQRRLRRMIWLSALT